MNVRQRYLRDATRAILVVFSSSEIARGAPQKAELQPGDLLDAWRGLLDGPDYMAAFSEGEKRAVDQFNAALEALIAQAGTRDPQMEDLLRLPDWVTVQARANDALQTIAA